MTVDTSVMKFHQIMCFAIIISFIFPLNVNALNFTLDFFPAESKPYGLTFEDWASKWWQWAYSQPKGSNPVVDDSQGNLCTNGQDSQNVWYLAGTFVNNSSVVRYCTVPLGKAILFPVSVAECSVSKSNWWNSLFSNVTEKLWKTCDAKMLKMNTAVDGQIANPVYVKSTKVFKLVFPQNNVKEVEPGEKEAVNKGYWLMIGPLPLGSHNITSFAVDSHNFRSNVTYYLTVK
jgi:hypothetical protein